MNTQYHSILKQGVAVAATLQREICEPGEAKGEGTDALKGEGIPWPFAYLRNHWQHNISWIQFWGSSSEISLSNRNSFNMVVQLGDFSSYRTCQEALDQFTNKYIFTQRLTHFLQIPENQLL